MVQYKVLICHVPTPVLTSDILMLKIYNIPQQLSFGKDNILIVWPHSND